MIVYIHILHNAIVETFTRVIVSNVTVCIELKQLDSSASEKSAKSFRYITVITHNLLT